jgi:hypothetical protein
MKRIILLALLGLSGLSTQAQDGRKLWLSAYSRAVVYSDNFETENQVDTATARRTQSGHALVDLGMHVEPVKDLEIHGMLRVRNDFGGFWGSGVTFDLRQLWVRGVIADVVKFQLGDLDYKMSPYTFRNEDEWILGGTSDVAQTSLDMLRYDIFQNNDETWRQQGLALDFGLQFKRGINEVDFSAFTTRVRASDQGFGPDRLFGGGMVDMRFLDDFNLRYHYANMFDIPGTTTDSVNINNPVQSWALKWGKAWENIELYAEGEAGISRMEWVGDGTAPVLEDGFADVSVGAYHPQSRLGIKVGWREVGANFRSPGAQTKRIQFNSAPQAYQRYTNDQVVRTLSSYDLLRDGTLYNTQLQSGLMAFDPKYGNALPYGLATPNRRGVNVGVEWSTPGDEVQIDANYNRMQDIVGQGTDDLRNFNVVTSHLTLNIHNLFDWERVVRISGFYSMEGTRRNSTPDYAAVDLQNQLMDVSFEWEFYRKLSILGEWRQLSAVGNELYAVRDEYTRVTDFTAVRYNAVETLFGGGLQYKFNDKIFAQVFYQAFDWQDTELNDLPYNWDNWQVNFVMTL